MLHSTPLHAPFFPRRRAANRDILPSARISPGATKKERTMAAKRMTQSQIVKTLAEKSEVSKKAVQQFLEHLAATAIGEVRKTGLFVLPGIGRLVRSDRKA